MEDTAELPQEIPATGVCRAVVDVGSNSVKLLVAQVQGSEVRPLLERSLQTRLGQGAFGRLQLSPEAIARTASAVAAFREEAHRHGISRFRVLATAAAREAGNQGELLTALQAAAGVEVEVLSGDQEAEMAFRGVCSEGDRRHRPLLVTDVGGGSSEFIVGRAGIRRFSHSLPLGAVRLFDLVHPSDPPTREEFRRCRDLVDAGLREILEDLAGAARALAADAPVECVGVGGTAVILARIATSLEAYDRARIESTVLSADTLAAIHERLWSQSLADRQGVIGLPPERADIILTGSAIYEGIVRLLDLPSLRPSTRGLRFAALMDP